MDKFEAVHYGQERALILGSPYRMNAKITAVARQINEGWEVYKAVAEHLKAYPLDGQTGAYAAVAEELNIGRWPEKSHAADSAIQRSTDPRLVLDRVAF